MDEETARASELADLLREGGEAERRNDLEAAHKCYARALTRAAERNLPDVQAEAALRLANLALHFNPTGEPAFARRRRLAEQAVDLCRQLGDRRGTARSLRLLATVSARPESERMMQESLQIARDLGDERELGHALERMAAHVAMREPERAEEMRAEAIAIQRRIGDDDGLATSLFGRAIGYLGSDPAASRAAAEECLALYRKVGRPKEIAQILMFLDDPNHPHPAERVPRLEEARAICRQIGIAIWEADLVRRLADIASAQGDDNRAQQLRAEAESICPEPQFDPEALAAFEKALEEKDRDQVETAAERLFG